MKNKSIRQLEYHVVRQIILLFVLAFSLLALVGGVFWFKGHVNKSVKRFESKQAHYLADKKNYSKYVSSLETFLKISSSFAARDAYMDAQDKYDPKYQKLTAMQTTINAKYNHLFSASANVPKILFTISQCDKITVLRNKDYKHVLVEVTNKKQMKSLYRFIFSGKQKKFVPYQGYNSEEGGSWTE